MAKRAKGARQEYKDSADLNKIMGRYTQRGNFKELIKEPMYADFSTVGDFREAMEKVMRAERQFNEIPARIRTMFNNDPGLFLDAWFNPQNDEFFVKNGLREKPIDESTPVVDSEKKVEELKPIIQTEVVK